MGLSELAKKREKRPTGWPESAKNEQHALWDGQKCLLLQHENKNQLEATPPLPHHLCRTALRHPVGPHGYRNPPATLRGRPSAGRLCRHPGTKEK